MMILSNRILIVDDDPLNVAILEEVLEEGFTLATASSGVEALRVAAEFKPDLFLLDIMMPEMDGYETCRRLRQNPELRFVKIILISAKAMLSERLKGYEAGADDYVTKPFDHAELLAKVKVFLRLKSTEEVSQLKTDFLVLLSHETRTPLNHILAPAELLAMEGSMEFRERKNLSQMVISGAERLRSLFEEAMFFFSFKTGRVHMEYDSVDLSALAMEVIQHQAGSASRRGVRVDLQAPEQLVIRGDRASIRALLSAALTQAMASESREIALSLSAGETEADITVPFDWEGDDPALVREAFEVFQVRDLRHHGTQTNLELPMIREIAQRHGGSVFADLTGAGEKVLRVRLPVRRAERQAA
jgi:two-component system sensor histidine kinase/response regulator